MLIVVLANTIFAESRVSGTWKIHSQINYGVRFSNMALHTYYMMIYKMYKTNTLSELLCLITILILRDETE